MWHRQAIWLVNTNHVTKIWLVNTNHEDFKNRGLSDQKRWRNQLQPRLTTVAKDEK